MVLSESFVFSTGMFYMYIYRGAVKCQSILSSGRMPKFLCLSLRSLMQKVGYAMLLRQWRPIILLSLMYKRLHRMFSSHIRPFMPNLMNISQTGFI